MKAIIDTIFQIIFGGIDKKKSQLFRIDSQNGVEDGARTHDPRYHKPML